jgi:cell division protein FtsI (penicillin-binding protein 3)
MIKRSRLRVQKQKKERRVILYLLVFAVLGAVGYQLERHYGITSSIKDALHSVKNTFSLSGPVRGTFYDRNLKQLAVTLDRVSVYARTREIDSIQKTATQLSHVFALDKDKLEKQLKSGVLRLWIAEDISQEQEISVKNLQLPGVFLQREEKRYYPNDFQAAHITGYVENGIGLSGVEFYYDRLLSGKKIKLRKKEQPLSNSLDFVLAIDLKIQGILESLVKDIGRSERADKVAAYLLESGTGEIIGGANLPGFNPNIFTKYSQEQTENIFLVPFCLPAKFRLFLRDATMLLAQDKKGVSPSAWSPVPNNNDLGSQLRLWEWLGLEEASEADFFVSTEWEKTTVNQQKPVIGSTIDYGPVPEFATPLSLLTTYSVLLNKGKKIHPFVVKKILDKKTGAEVLLTGKKNADEQLISWSDNEGKRVESLFRSQAKQTASGTTYFRDDILVSVKNDGKQQFLINDMMFIKIPAGSNDLNMLIVMQRTPPGVNSEDGDKENSIQHLVEEKAERISVLQQIAKSVADVVEAEAGDDDNYQVKNRLGTGVSDLAKTVKEDKLTPGIMPDLKGLSLRKSLRMLQGINVELHIQGTGSVVAQKPMPGTSLKGITDCFLTLEKQENVTPEKLRHEQPEKD